MAARKPRPAAGRRPRRGHRARRGGDLAGPLGRGRDGAAAELITLLVDPLHARAGHGSRLLAATADLLREDGFTTLTSWVFEGDEVTRTFLGSAGWAPDGTARTLDMGEPVRQIRLHTDISDTDVSA
jgi:GNAT superfamily N-acetyltransferase